MANEFVASGEAVVDLRVQPALQEIEVRPGVVLRPLAESDAGEILQFLQSDPELRERVSFLARVSTVEDVEREVEACRKDGTCARYVIRNEGKLAGVASLWQDTGFFGQEPKPYAFGFGYGLDPAYRGQGIAVDSISRLMETAASSFRVDTFMAFCEDDNRASIAVLERLGLERTEVVYAEPNLGWAERLYEKGVAA